jgi:hypothetical protein
MHGDRVLASAVLEPEALIRFLVLAFPTHYLALVQLGRPPCSEATDGVLETLS